MEALDRRLMAGTVLAAATSGVVDTTNLQAALAEFGQDLHVEQSPTSADNAQYLSSTSLDAPIWSLPELGVTQQAAADALSTGGDSAGTSGAADPSLDPVNRAADASSGSESSQPPSEAIPSTDTATSDPVAASPGPIESTQPPVVSAPEPAGSDLADQPTETSDAIAELDAMAQNDVTNLSGNELDSAAMSLGGGGGGGMYVLTSVPNAPSNAYVSGTLSKKVNWTDNSSDESGFIVQQATDPTFTYDFESYQAAANSHYYTVGQLTSHEQFYFRVYAYNGSGNSAFSNTATVEGAGSGATPSAPTNLGATVASSTQINLSWTDTQGTYSETGFRIERSTSSAFDANIFRATVGANVTSYQNTGLQAGTTYYYRVRAYNDDGYSYNSNVANATTQSGNSAPTVATAASATPSPATGTTASLSVLGADDGGEANLTYTWATTGTPPAAVSFSANGTHAAKNTTATFTKAGTYSLQVTIQDVPGLSVTSSVNLTVNQTLSSITVTPATTTIDNGMTAQFSAVARDQFGTALSTQPSFSWSVQGGGVGGTINGSGLYTAPSSGNGNATVVATSGMTSGTALVTVTTPTIPNPPGNLSIGGFAQKTLSWQDNSSNEASFGVQQATDPTFSYELSQVSVSANVTSYAVDMDELVGNATYYFRVYAVNAAGNSAYSNTASFVASSNGQTPPVPTNLLASPVSPEQVNLAWTDVTGQYAETGFRIERSTNSAFDQNIFRATVGANTISYADAGLQPNTTYYYRVRAFNGAGFSANSNSVSVTTPAVNQPPTVAVPPSATPSPATGTTATLSVLGADDSGEPNLSYTWATTGTPPAPVTFSANGTHAARNTTATFTKAGTYNFQVTIQDVPGLSVTSSVSVNVNQTLSSIVISPASAALNETGAQWFIATGYDQFGDVLDSQPTFTWSKVSGIGNIDSYGLYTAPGAAGSATIRASSGGVSAMATITVSNSVPSIVVPASASPATVTGCTTNLSALGADDNFEANLTYTWVAASRPAEAQPVFSVNGSNAAKDTTVTFDQAGSYTFTVTISDGQGGSVTSEVTVAVQQTLTSLIVLPAEVTLELNASQQFSAAGYDQFGDTMAELDPLDWSIPVGVGTINSATGFYESGTQPGTASVQATSPTGISGTATVTVTNHGPSIVTGPYAEPNLVVSGFTSNLSVLADDDGGEANLVYTWAATTTPGGASPVFSVNGSNAAKSTLVTFDCAGAYVFTITVADGTGAVVAGNVSVTVQADLHSVVVSPSTVSLNEQATHTFAAIGYDRFGQALSEQPVLTWSIDDGGVGSIDSATGVYNSGSVAGQATVRATCCTGVELSPHSRDRSVTPEAGVYRPDG